MAKFVMPRSLSNDLNPQTVSSVRRLLESLMKPFSTEVMYLVVQQLVEARSKKEFANVLRQISSPLSTDDVKLKVKRIIAAIERKEEGSVPELPLEVRLQYVRLIEEVLNSSQSQDENVVDEQELQQELDFLKSVA